MDCDLDGIAPISFDKRLVIMSAEDQGVPNISALTYARVLAIDKNRLFLISVGGNCSSGKCEVV